MKLSEAPKSPPKVLLYGPPGAGKTVLAATLGEGCCYIDLDLNIDSARTLKDKFFNERQQIDYFPYVDADPLAPTRFERVKAKILELLNGGYKKYTSIVVDSFTMVGQASIENTMRVEGKINRSNGTFTTKSGSYEQQHYGVAMMELEKLLIWLKSMPLSTVVIAHQEMKPPVETKEGAVSNSSVEIAVLGAKLAPKIPAYFTEVWYQTASMVAGGAISYNLRTKNTGSILARSCNNLPERVDANEGMWAIFKRMGYERPVKEIVNASTNK